jgi:hypothetical protein
VRRKFQIAKNQHYVPQFILRNFTVGDGNQIFVFDKQNEKSFKTNIRNVAAESDFYNFDIDEYQFTIESGLGQLEGQTSEAFEKIIKDKSLSNLDDDDRVKIASFISVQIYRTRHFRDKLSDISKGMSERSRLYGFDPDQEGFPKPLNEKEIKDVSIKMVMRDSEELIPHILDKKWMLYETTESDPFYISDNPIVRQNRKDFGPLWGNLGLAVTGIEVYFPLTKTLSMAMLCQSYEETFQDELKKFEFLRAVLPGFERQLPVDLEWIERHRRGYEEGAAVSMMAENVVNHNSLQVKWSSRFVFSSKNDFSLVREMIAAEPRFKNGIKIRTS